jgi:hypothetical protein
VLACVVAVLAGLGAGVLGSFAHASTSYGLPVGLVAALGLCLGVFAVARLAGSSRAPVAGAAVGWATAVLLLSVQRPEGDLVVPGTALGYCWLVGGMLGAAATVSWPSASAGAFPSASSGVRLPASTGSSPPGR